MLCDTLLHLSCAERKGFKSFGRVLGICVQCEENITSPSCDPKSKDIYLLAKVNNKLNRYEAMAKKLSVDNTELKKKVEDYSQKNAELKESALKHKREIEILNDLVSEIKDKNGLLVEKNEYLNEKNAELNAKCKKIEAGLTSTYAQVTSNNTKYKYLGNVNTTQSIIITPKETQTAEKTKSDIVNNIDLESLKVKVISVKKMNEGRIKVICCNEDGTEKLKNEIHDTMENKYETNVEKFEMPKIKIVGIQI
ncbi:unnamed protein product [Brassicogethes aeneus]|uniref:Uncharacterized protein n=1 Tax=Brassicogethes aeneus TaxID=1431903 RepID=A0A9P0BAZ5_BRAAE|nr:unnamed protein product [Brassicogethes aeneus]